MIARFFPTLPTDFYALLSDFDLCMYMHIARYRPQKHAIIGNFPCTRNKNHNNKSCDAREVEKLR